MSKKAKKKVEKIGLVYKDESRGNKYGTSGCRFI